MSRYRQTEQERRDQQVFELLRDIRARITRIETRIVILANEAGMGHVFKTAEPPREGDDDVVG